MRLRRSPRLGGSDGKGSDVLAANLELPAYADRLFGHSWRDGSGFALSS